MTLLAKEEFSEILRTATESIDPRYFDFYIDGEEHPIYRERVYCYELYHQMRCRWPKETPYLLNGEVDKRGHKLLAKKGAALYVPDFLVHTPGRMAGNSIIMEVKHSWTNDDGIENDLVKLDLFIRDVDYKRAIYLVYGKEADSDFILRIQNIAFSMRRLSEVEVWLHSAPHQPARHAASFFIP